MNNVLETVYSAILQHVPSDASWLPRAGAVAAALFGIILLIKGAKLAPMLTAVGFIGLGGIGGSFVSNWIGTPIWPTILVGGVVGFIAGIALFRLWLSGMVAACFIVASLGFYGVRVLQPHLDKYVSEGPHAFTGQVRLLDAAEVTARESVTPTQELSQLWGYLGQNVSNFEPSFYAIVISSGIAGLVFGLLVSRLARALWASTAGVALSMIGAVALLQAFAPGILQYLSSQGTWTWGAIAAIWGLSLLHNLRDCSPKRVRKQVDVEGSGTPATA